MNWFARVWIVVLCVHLATAQSSNAEERRFLIRIWDSWKTTRPAGGPITVEDCLVVRRDGHFHLELRRQEFIGGRASLHIYEGKLDDASRGTLKNLLNADSIRKLPPFQSAGFQDLTSDSVESVRAAIARSYKTQDVGYFAVKAHGPDSPQVVDKDQQESWKALEPLLQWFRALKTNKDPTKHRVSHPASGLCESTP